MGPLFESVSAQDDVIMPRHLLSRLGVDEEEDQA